MSKKKFNLAETISRLFFLRVKSVKSPKARTQNQHKETEEKGMKTEGKEKLIKSESVRVHRRSQQPHDRSMKSSQVVVCVMCVAFILQNDKKIPKAKKGSTENINDYQLDVKELIKLIKNSFAVLKVSFQVWSARCAREGPAYRYRS